ncbi:MAG: FecR domain-containing protein [Myxococcota bacterium]
MHQGWARIIIVPGVLTGLALMWWAWPTGPRVQIVEVDGMAELSRSGVQDPIVAQEGILLEVSDNVRTGAGGAAVIQFGSHTQIRIGPTSSVEVATVEDEGLFLELEEGAVRAIVRPDSGQVRIGNEGRSVVGSDATFDVGVRDAVLQVRAVEGDVALEGVDRTGLSEGQTATIRDRTAEVGDVPASLLLLVAPPEVDRTAERTLTVRGQTVPSADVEIAGPVKTHRTRSNAEGEFELPITLIEGENSATVQATNVFGESQSKNLALPVLDTTAPKVGDSEVEYPR